MEDRYLKGKVALVSGGASGIGRATALQLARAGANIAVGSLLAVNGRTRPDLENTFLPPDAMLQDTKREIEEQGVHCVALPLDVRSDESVETLYQAAVRQLGPVDIAVAAAGVDANQGICGHPDALWHQIIDTNLNGTYRIIRRCLPVMMERNWGRIVIIGTTSANVGHPLKPAYSASKTGLLGLMRCVALEGAPRRVTCNMVSPATVETEMLRTTFLHTAAKTGKTVEALTAERLKSYPQNRLLRPEEVASLSVFLCREESLGITMENITISAGATF